MHSLIYIYYSYIYLRSCSHGFKDKINSNKDFTDRSKAVAPVLVLLFVAGLNIPASILYKSTAGRYRPVSYPDGPITVRCRFIKNAYWDDVMSGI